MTVIDGDALYPRQDWPPVITREDRDRDNLRRVRLALKHEPPGTVVKLRCFSKSEADWVAEHLDPSERERVIYTWLEFDR